MYLIKSTLHQFSGTRRVSKQSYLKPDAVPSIFEWTNHQKLDTINQDEPSVSPTIENNEKWNKVCMICKAVFLYTVALGRHYKNEHNVSSLKCMKCGVIISPASTFQRHVCSGTDSESGMMCIPPKHEENNLFDYECTACHQTFEDMVDFNDSNHLCMRGEVKRRHDLGTVLKQDVKYNMANYDEEIETGTLSNAIKIAKIAKDHGSYTKHNNFLKEESLLDKMKQPDSVVDQQSLIINHASQEKTQDDSFTLENYSPMTRKEEGLVAPILGTAVVHFEDFNHQTLETQHNIGDDKNHKTLDNTNHIKVQSTVINDTDSVREALKLDSLSYECSPSKVAHDSQFGMKTHLNLNNSDILQKRVVKKIHT